MRVIIHSDIHGRNNWEKTKEVPHDLMIFLGDYFDNYEDTPHTEQIDNFHKIVNNEKTIALIGNHDFHYMRGIGSDRYSGFQQHALFDIREAIEKYELNPVHVIDNYVFSHAGISKHWFKNLRLKKFIDINDLFKVDIGRFRFIGPDPYGDSVWEGPLWIRPNSLGASLKFIDNKLFVGLTQFVGHTRVRNPTEATVKKCRVVFTDDENKHYTLLDTETGTIEHLAI